MAQHFLKDTKEDVPYSSIAKLFQAGPAERATLARYCLKDTTLPMRLLTQLCIVVNLVEMVWIISVSLIDCC